MRYQGKITANTRRETAATNKHDSDDTVAGWNFPVIYWVTVGLRTSHVPRLES